MAAPLHVAVVAACPFPYPRGTPTRVYRSAEIVARLGHRVDVITYHLGETERETPFAVHRIRPVGHYHRLAPGPTYQKLLVVDTLLVARLLAFVRRHPVDVIHAHHYEGLLVALPVSRLFGIPLVYDAHTLLDSELEHYDLHLPPTGKRRLGRLLDHWAPRLAHHVIATTETIKYALTRRHGLAGERVTIVTGGVEFDHFTWPGPRRDDPPTLIYTGNMGEFQGVDRLLRAFALVRRERPNARLQIMTGGDFGRHAPLVAELALDGAIDLLPESYDALPQRLGEATVAVNPRPVAAGLPLKLLNYLAAACPIVSFAGSAGKLLHDHQAWLVDGDDPAALAQGILHLLGDPALRARLGESARRYARAEFNWLHQGRLIEEVYVNLLRQRRAHLPAHLPGSSELPGRYDLDDPGSRP